MNKRITIVIIVLILIGGGIYYFSQLQTSPDEGSLGKVDLNSLIPVDPLSGEPINENSKLMSQDGQSEVTFRLLTDEEHRGRNPIYETFINQARIGEVGGYLRMPRFSPDGKFLAFRSMGVGGCAGTCFYSGISILDFTNRTIISITPPKNKGEYLGSAEIPGGEINNVIIEPYGWDDGVFKMALYYAGYSWPTEDTPALCADGKDNDNDGSIDMQDGDCTNIASSTINQENIARGQYYRVGPKELWQYDLNTKEYAFVEILPE